jgi:hypothetical protein
MILVLLLIQGMMGSYPLPAIVGMSSKDIQFHLLRPSQFPTSKWTHVCTTGVVSLRRREEDGDWHLRISDAPSFIVAEIIPEIPFVAPLKGQRVRICGIRRFDTAHGWWEIHPVTRQIEVLK